MCISAWLHVSSAQFWFCQHKFRTWANSAQTHLCTEEAAGSRFLTPCSWWKHSQRVNNQDCSCRIQMLHRKKCQRCCLWASRWWCLEDGDTSQLESRETNNSVDMRILMDCQRVATAPYLCSLDCSLLISSTRLNNWFCNPVTPSGFGNGY